MQLSKQRRVSGNIESIQDINISEIEYHLALSPHKDAVLELLKKYIIFAPNCWWIECGRRMLGDLADILIRMTKDEDFLVAEISRVMDIETRNKQKACA
jgi:hypothetical protein